MDENNKKIFGKMSQSCSLHPDSTGFQPWCPLIWEFKGQISSIYHQLLTALASHTAVQNCRDCLFCSLNYLLLLLLLTLNPVNTYCTFEIKGKHHCRYTDEHDLQIISGWQRGFTENPPWQMCKQQLFVRKILKHRMRVSSMF